MRWVISLLLFTLSAYATETNKVATQKAIADYRAAVQRANAWRGEPKKVQITKCLGDLGRSKCLASIDGNQKEILIKLPPVLKQAFDESARLSKQIEGFAADVKQQDDKVERAGAITPTGGTYEQRTEYYNRVSLMALDVKRQKEILEEMRTKLSGLNRTIKGSNTFMASQTAQKYAGLEIWEYVGPVPAKKK